MTGGSFAAKVRAPDLQRAREAYVTAADLVEHVRQAANRGNRLSRIVLRELEARLPYRRPDTHAGRIEEIIWLAVSFGFFLVGCGFIVLWYLQ
jgi:hypothetical protein